MIAEVSKKLLKTSYKGNLKSLLKAKDYLEFNQATIKAAFGNGNGNEADFERYMSDNRKYCIYLEV